LGCGLDACCRAEDKKEKGRLRGGREKKRGKKVFSHTLI